MELENRKFVKELEDSESDWDGNSDDGGFKKPAKKPAKKMKKKPKSWGYLCPQYWIRI